MITLPSGQTIDPAQVIEIGLDVAPGPMMLAIEMVDGTIYTVRDDMLGDYPHNAAELCLMISEGWMD